MSLVIIRRREIRLVGRNQRQALSIGEIDQAAFNTAFLVDAMALQFDIQAVTEQAGKALTPRHCEFRMTGLQRQRDRPVRPTRQRDQPLGLIAEPIQLDVWI